MGKHAYVTQDFVALAIAHCHLGLGKLYGHTGDVEQAGTALEKAHVARLSDRQRLPIVVFCGAALPIVGQELRVCQHAQRGRLFANTLISRRSHSVSGRSSVDTTASSWPRSLATTATALDAETRLCECSPAMVQRFLSRSPPFVEGSKRGARAGKEVA